MRKVYVIERGQLIGDRFQLGISEVYSSKKDAEFAVEQEIEINKGSKVTKDTWELSGQTLLQTDYSWFTKDDREVRMRTIIRIMELRSFH